MQLDFASLCSGELASSVWGLCSPVLLRHSHPEMGCGLQGLQLLGGWGSQVSCLHRCWVPLRLRTKILWSHLCHAGELLILDWVPFKGRNCSFLFCVHNTFFVWGFFSFLSFLISHKIVLYNLLKGFFFLNIPSMLHVKHMIITAWDKTCISSIQNVSQIANYSWKQADNRNINLHTLTPAYIQYNVRTHLWLSHICGHISHQWSKNSTKDLSQLMFCAPWGRTLTAFSCTAFISSFFLLRR